MAIVQSGRQVERRGFPPEGMPTAVLRDGDERDYGEEFHANGRRRRGTRSMSCVNYGSEYSPDEIEFMLAIDRYKREKKRPWPSWSEVLEIARALGYRKVQ